MLGVVSNPERRNRTASAPTTTGQSVGVPKAPDDQRWPDALKDSARLYPYRCDLPKETFCFIALDEDEYRSQSFLDGRALSPDAWHAWLKRSSVDHSLAGASTELPLHFIFHTGHAGSTLVSRLLDWVSPTLPLREPLLLRQLCDGLDADPAGRTLRAMWETTWRLWGRGFAETRAVLVKATSHCARHAVALVGARDQSRAVYLGLHRDRHLPTLLAKPGTLSDLAGFREERARRLRAMLGIEPPATMTAGELAAMSWLCESLTREQAVHDSDGRILGVDFDTLVDRPNQQLHAALRHLGLTYDEQRLERIADCPLFGRYAKATEHEFTPAMREQMLRQVCREQRREIRRANRWLEHLGRASGKVAALLGSTDSR